MHARRHISFLLSVEINGFACFKFAKRKKHKLLAFDARLEGIQVQVSNQFKGKSEGDEHVKRLVTETA